MHLRKNRPIYALRCNGHRKPLFRPPTSRHDVIKPARLWHTLGMKFHSARVLSNLAACVLFAGCATADPDLGGGDGGFDPPGENTGGDSFGSGGFDTGVPPATGGLPQGGAPGTGGISATGGAAGNGATYGSGGAGGTFGTGGESAGGAPGAGGEPECFFPFPCETGGAPGSGGGPATGAGGGLPGFSPSPDNPPECPQGAPENPIGDCLGLPVYLGCSYSDGTRVYNCICDWYHWLCL